MSALDRDPGSAESPSLAGLWRVLEAFEGESWSEVKLVAGDVEIHLRRDSTGMVADDEPALAQTSRRAASPSAAAAAAEAPAPDVMHSAHVLVQDLPDDPDSPSVAAELEVEVESPSVGVFWAQPHPGEPTFVSIGAHVEPDTTVCIIEIMKLMNHVKAATAGRITRILAANGQTVEKGQPLFLVVPDKA